METTDVRALVLVRKPDRSWIRRVLELARGPHPDLARNSLVSAVIVLVAVGTIFVFSASYYQLGVAGDAFYFFRRQLLWLPIAILAAAVAYHFDYRLLARSGNWFFLLLLTLGLLTLVLVPGVGREVNYSRRWLPLGSLQFQPSELAKLAMIVFLAGFFSHDPARLRRFVRGFLPLTLCLLAVVILILVEPDFGTAMFVLGLAGLLMVVAGVRRLYIFCTAAIFSPIISLGIAWRWELVQTRLLGFLDPEGIHQVRHSLIALGNGGLFGVGLGAGTQKLRFLPEPQTDFIFAVVGEELGYLGSVAILALFVALLWSSVGIARRARDYFGFLLASGISLSLAMQAATNLAVVTASAPTKGIPLPFLTFGGSGLCMTLAQVGILLSIDRIRQQEGPVSGGLSAEPVPTWRPESGADGAERGQEPPAPGGRW